MPRFTIGAARRGLVACLAGIAISGTALALIGALDAPSLPAAVTPDPNDASPSGISAPAPQPSMAAATSSTTPSPGISLTSAPNAAPVPPSQSGATLLTRPQLAQLVAPIALYPDPLLAQILMAATYPLEVVEAARWVNINGNKALKGDALTTALAAQNWDPSVEALVPFPRVLQMMSDQLQWTEELGNAFLAQQADVMAAVQSLRQEAMVAGNLSQSPQCRCVIHSSGGTISILPAEPQVVCVPVYTPAVYGPWPYPAYPPDYFRMPVGFALAPGFWVGFAPPVELAVFAPFWGWGWIDWGHRWIGVDTARLALVSRGHVWFSGNVWVHDPVHRGGVAYVDLGSRARFDAGRVAAVAAAVRSGAVREAGARLGGAARFAGGEAFHGGAGHFAAAAAAHAEAAGSHGGAAFHRRWGSNGRAAFHGGGSHGGEPHFAMGGPHGGGGPHFAMGSPRGGGGPHFAVGGPHGGGGPHFAMGGPHGGGGGRYGGGPRGGSGPGGRHG